MTSLSKSYSAKVLLFGEYTIIGGGMALSMPCDKFSGRWVDDAQGQLQPFFEHLKTIDGYNKEKLDNGIKTRLSFDSTIPLGYGLGSSGALTAAAFDHFYTDKSISMSELKNILSQSENFFHGNSSGLDPLTIYLNKTILVEGDDIKVIPEINLNNKFGLIDSNQTRNTKTLVAYYKDQLKDPDFANAIVNLNLLNEMAINSMLSQDEDSFNNTFSQISQLQFRYFQHMIPRSIKEVWADGLKSEKYYVKLSGAGGGGCFLVYGGFGKIKGVTIL